MTRLKGAWRFAAGNFVVFLAIHCAASAPTTAPYGVDLDGRPVPLAQSTGPAIVLFFTATDCPIANRYEPEMLRLEREFALTGIAFWWVYPNPEDTAEKIRRHQSQFGGSTHIIRDTQQSLVQIAHVKLTPEAAVFVPSSGMLREIYVGRIDDRYISLGQERPHANHYELDEAIAALLAKRPILKPGGPPVGCSIVPLEASNQP